MAVSTRVIFGSFRVCLRRGSILGCYALNDDRWLSVDEIAAYFGIKRDTMYKWIERKNMPAHKVGKLWTFRKEEVDGWVSTGGPRVG